VSQSNTGMHKVNFLAGWFFLGLNGLDVYNTIQVTYSIDRGGEIFDASSILAE